ncbi:hypothetical protein ONZ45_g16889 [Pleurotus djamor]|nr:hypothetical protein ONZ45_g16889 [Pleurotus djamor]
MFRFGLRGKLKTRYWFLLAASPLMFSSFRNAIDNLAQLPKETQAVRRGSDPLAPSDGREPPSRTGSLDMSRSQSTPLSSSQLAESALSNLRKSLASTHTANPGPGPRTSSMSTSVSDSAIRPAKSRLEDRLRAKLAAADASSRGSTTPVSPTSTPSPHEVQLPSTSETPSSDPKTEAESVGSQAKVDEEVDSRHPEADIPLPQDAVDPPENVASQDSEPLPSSEAPAPESPSIPTQSQSTDSQTPSVEASEPATDEPTEDSVPDSPPHNPTADPPHPLEPTGAIEEPNPAVVDATPVSQVETSEDPPVDVAESRPHDQSVDELQEQLRAFEKRFADVTESFKKLQAERDAADRVLRDASPLEGLQDVDGFRDYLQNMTLKVEMAEDEIKRLNGKLTRQDDRIEELRDTHRLESHSQSDQIERLRQQVQETDALFKASQDAITKHEDQSSELRAEIEKLKSDLGRSQVVAKEEEEKR